MPSIEVAKKIADALHVSLDFLAGNSKQAALDKQTLRLIHDIEELEPAVKDKLFFLANAIIRDAKPLKLTVIKQQSPAVPGFTLLHFKLLTILLAFFSNSFHGASGIIILVSV
jgi:hypothetical protein